ncbi:hypothetical protein LGK95_01285 [Clostridium algoriphilum]|uniref:hypothetical protein n=1 Tax=Clostridium algoriphilum TaxID=198347 RepID=UPI001CF1237A|nr:hypothetical protein [Clostridium algoriphilum]MCB2292169.1 hypothetical protein [Clostridium algoriphilum]
MNDDKYLIASIIGIISIIPSEIVSQILIGLGYNKYSTCTLSSLLITGDKPSLIMGIIVNSVIAGFIAIILYQTIRKIGSQHLVIKCVGGTLLIWLTLELLFSIFIERKLIAPRGMSGYYSHFLGAITFGITEGMLFNKFLFNKNMVHKD